MSKPIIYFNEKKFSNYHSQIYDSCTAIQNKDTDYHTMLLNLLKCKVEVDQVDLGRSDPEKPARSGPAPDLCWTTADQSAVLQIWKQAGVCVDKEAKVLTSACDCNLEDRYFPGPDMISFSSANVNEVVKYKESMFDKFRKTPWVPAICLDGEGYSYIVSPSFEGFSDEKMKKSVGQAAWVKRPTNPILEVDYVSDPKGNAISLCSGRARGFVGSAIGARGLGSIRLNDAKEIVPSGDKDESSGGKNTGLIIGGIVFGVVLLIGVFLAVLGGKKGDSEKPLIRRGKKGQKKGGALQALELQMMANGQMPPPMQGVPQGMPPPMGSFPPPMQM